MQQVEPEVYLISRPSIAWDQVEQYLDAVGGRQWYNRLFKDSDAEDGEILIEFMGRNCYRSWEPGLNANVTKVREDTEAYLQNLVNVGHGSVFEHANYSFVFDNVSRVFTHELVRHRAGVAISQESLRFVRLTDLDIWLPEAIRNQPEHGDATVEEHEEFIASFVSIVEKLEEWQGYAAAHYGLDDEGVPFAYKKHVTSALRRVAPIGLATRIGWTANIRTLRHVIEMRTSLGAEEEIRVVFDKVAKIMRDEAPRLFADYDRTPDGEWVTESTKV